MLSLPMRPEVRPCGPCTVCCTVLGVRSMGKPYYVPCRHQSHKGCRIHSSRPDDCRAYECTWRIGLFGDGPEGRPDSLGVLFDISIQDDNQYLDIYESRQGGFDAVSDDLVEEVAKQLSITAGPFYAYRLFPHGCETSHEFATGKDYIAYKDREYRIRDFRVEGKYQVFVRNGGSYEGR